MAPKLFKNPTKHEHVEEKEKRLRKWEENPSV